MIERIDSFRGKYDFLSNFYRNKSMPVEYEGMHYPSVEHAYQAAKTVDIAVRKPFTKETMTSGQSKHAGRKLKLRDNWEQIKLDVMLTCLRSKFDWRILRQMLLDTGEVELVEGNTWGDTFWGQCQGRGENHLGKLLMRLREEYRALPR